VEVVVVVVVVVAERGGGACFGNERSAPAKLSLQGWSGRLTLHMLAIPACLLFTSSLPARSRTASAAVAFVKPVLTPGGGGKMSQHNTERGKWTIDHVPLLHRCIERPSAINSADCKAIRFKANVDPKGIGFSLYMNTPGIIRTSYQMNLISQAQVHCNQASLTICLPESSLRAESTPVMGFPKDGREDINVELVGYVGYVQSANRPIILCTDHHPHLVSRYAYKRRKCNDRLVDRKEKD